MSRRVFVQSMPPTQPLAPGARVIIRDAEWLVRKVDRTSTGGQAVSVIGLSELVKDKEAIFLSEIEERIEVIDPVETRYVADRSAHYRDSLLYIESLLRQTPPTDDRLYIGYKSAIDLVPYQLEPAILALEQPRQRILFADAVGCRRPQACRTLGQKHSPHLAHPHSCHFIANSFS